MKLSPVSTGHNQLGLITIFSGRLLKVALTPPEKIGITYLLKVYNQDRFSLNLSAFQLSGER